MTIVCLAWNCNGWSGFDWLIELFFGDSECIFAAKFNLNNEIKMCCRIWIISVTTPFVHQTIQYNLVHDSNHPDKQTLWKTHWNPDPEFLIETEWIEVWSVARSLPFFSSTSIGWFLAVLSKLRGSIFFYNIKRYRGVSDVIVWEF